MALPTLLCEVGVAGVGSSARGVHGTLLDVEHFEALVPGACADEGGLPSAEACIDAILQAFDARDGAVFSDGCGLVPLFAVLEPEIGRERLCDAVLERLFDPLLDLDRREHLASCFALVLARREHNAALTFRLEGDDEDDRIVAARALGSSANLEALPGLSRALDDESPRVREAAIEAIACLGAPEATLVLLEALLVAPTRRLRSLLLGALRRSPVTPQLVPAVGDAFARSLEDEDPAARRAALSGLVAVDRARARVHARAALEDADAGVRLLAAGALAGSGEAQDVEHLLARAGDEDPRVRAAIRDSLESFRRRGS